MRWIGILLLFLLITRSDADISGYAPYPRERLEWQKFYKEYFKIEKNFGHLKIPKPKEGFDRLLIIVKGVSADKILKVLKNNKVTITTAYNDFNSVISQPSPNDGKDYAVWIQDQKEPDSTVAPSAAAGHSLMTFEERLLYELKYFCETGKHLDVIGYTFCLSSRDGDGYISVDWVSGDEMLRILYFFPNNEDNPVQVRSVIR